MLLAGAPTAACGRTITAVSDGGAASSSSSAAAAPVTEAASTGKLVPEYGAATSADAMTGAQLARESMLLEQMAEAADALFKLPRDFPLKGAECGGFNAFYDPVEQSITMCYEMFTTASLAASTRAGTDAAMADRRYSGIVSMIFFHEFGHMVRDIYQLPTTGREEDNADQLATLILIGDGSIESGQQVIDAAQFWFDISAGTQPGIADFADEHSLNEQRGFNLLCWVYGSDNAAYADLVAPTGALPAERAVQCASEYSQIYDAWLRLLDPYLEVDAGDSMAPS